MTQLSELEIELLAIVRTMSSKLLDVAEYLRHENTLASEEVAIECEAYAEYHSYIEKFGLQN